MNRDTTIHNYSVEFMNEWVFLTIVFIVRGAVWCTQASSKNCPHKKLKHSHPHFQGITSKFATARTSQATVIVAIISSVSMGCPARRYISQGTDETPIAKAK